MRQIISLVTYILHLPIFKLHEKSLNGSVVKCLFSAQQVAGSNPMNFFKFFFAFSLRNKSDSILREKEEKISLFLLRQQLLNSLNKLSAKYKITNQIGRQSAVVSDHSIISLIVWSWVQFTRCIVSLLAPCSKCTPELLPWEGDGVGRGTGCKHQALKNER